jgi:hypothetical protein
MTTPASGGSLDFDRNRLSQGELIAGISAVLLIIFMFFDWYGAKASGSIGGVHVSQTASGGADAWEAFSFIDILLFLLALVTVAIVLLRGLNRMPDTGFPESAVIAGAGVFAVLLILFRIIDTPDAGVGFTGPIHVEITRKVGIFLGLIAAGGMAYGGWRAMEESGTSVGDLTAGRASGGGGAAAAAAPTTPMPATGADTPGVPGGGAAGVSPGKEGPGAPHPGTSTGAPGDEGDAPPAPAAPDPVPGTTAGQTTPGLAGEPPAEGGTTAPGL